MKRKTATFKSDGAPAFRIFVEADRNWRAAAPLQLNYERSINKYPRK